MLLCALIAVGAAGQGRAQDGRESAPQQAVPQPSSDPRAALKPGLRDAGQVARNLELVAAVPKPKGFFDPASPAGEPTAPERNPAKPGEPDPPDKPEAEEPPARRSELGFANTDLAFRGEQLFLGNYHGFNAYDIEDPRKARVIASIVCPGGQGDVSVHGNLLFMSVEQTRARLDCGMQGIRETVSTERFRGVRIFDISDVRKPKQVAAVQTCRGSHTHTLLSDPDDRQNLYVYVSGTSSVRSPQELAGCSGKDPKEDPDTALFSIDVIQVPLAAPQHARIVSRPRIFADPSTGAIAGLWPGGSHGPGTQRSRITNQCHDITVFPEVGLAAGACSGNGILLDITDPVKPVRLDAATDKNFAYWHSATFNNDGTKVIFTDEWGGGTRPRCRPDDPPAWGGNAIFDIVDRKLRFAGYYKLPVPQTEQENCVAHNGSIIPVPGRDIMVQAWYQGGLSVFDFTDSSKPIEIAYFDRGPLDSKRLITGGYWSTYWFNGHIYGAEIARGLDIFRLKPSEQLTQNEIDAALQVKLPAFNAQQQPRIVWPATAVTARAYLDQLTRSRTITPDRARALRAAVERAEKRRPGSSAAAADDQLGAMATELESQAGGATGRDAVRLRSLIEIVKTLSKKPA
jgi:hypothetical protein